MTACFVGYSNSNKSIPSWCRWIRQAGPIFDYSLALEMMTFFGDDVAEGVKSVREKRDPVFPSAQSS